MSQPIPRKPHRPLPRTTGGVQPAWIIETSAAGGTGGLGGAPDVIIDNYPNNPTGPPVNLIWGNDKRVEVDVLWHPGPTANAQNFSGVAVYLEDPDISSGTGTSSTQGVPLDATTQPQGQWVPVHINDVPSSPAVVLLDSTMGSTAGMSYQRERDIRVYLAAYGPNTLPVLRRATDPNPTPNILVHIPTGPGIYTSGEEYTWLVTLDCAGKNGPPSVSVTTNFASATPSYTMAFRYTPPDPSIPLPAGLSPFRGARIYYVYLDSSGNPLPDPVSGQVTGTDTGIVIYANQSGAGIMSPTYTIGSGGSFRVYFLSLDDQGHANTLVPSVTPYCTVTIAPPGGAPDVTGFSITPLPYRWMLDGSYVAEANFAWNIPTSGAYSGVMLYLVKVTGNSGPNQSKFPRPLTGALSNVDPAYLMDVNNLPSVAETWTIAAVSVDSNGHLADDPTKYGAAGWHSPTVTWTLGGPIPATGAPLVTVGAGAAAATKGNESTSSDGVRLVSFHLEQFTQPTGAGYGGVQIAMVLNGQTGTPTYWSVPNGATSFDTPAIPAPGNFGAAVNVAFYFVSDDPAGHKNPIITSGANATPQIPFSYTPTQGAVIPARTGWFDPTQFKWSTSGQFQAGTFSAQNIQVGSKLIVGGAPTTFAGQDNGQIAVMNSSQGLVAWMGTQQPGQGNGAATYGAWFGQVWVGGPDGPLHAPLYVDNYGVVVVGGIAAANNATYPYISLRNASGIEYGRLGAQIGTAPASPQPGTIQGNQGSTAGGTVPSLTSGAWFSQLAIGGSSMANWNILVVPDPNNSIGSQVQIRNVFQFLIDYPQTSVSGQLASEHYQLLMGNSVWTDTATGSGWKFPGMFIYRVDAQGGTKFGTIYMSRGMVVRGTYAQNYNVLLDANVFNGDTSGAESNQNFYPEINMYAPTSPWGRIFNLTGQSSAAALTMWNASGLETFGVTQYGDVVMKGVLQGIPGTSAAPVMAYALTIYNNGAPVPVIDSTGHWIGPGISGSGGGSYSWTQAVVANGFGLSGGGIFSVSQLHITAAAASNTGIWCDAYSATYPVINSAAGISCTSINNTGPYYGSLIQSNTNIVCSASSTGALPAYTSVFDTLVIKTSFNIPALNVGSGVVPAGALISINQNILADASRNLTTGAINASGAIVGATVGVPGVTCINGSGQWIGGNIGTSWADSSSRVIWASAVISANYYVWNGAQQQIVNNSMAWVGAGGVNTSGAIHGSSYYVGATAITDTAGNWLGGNIGTSYANSSARVMYGHDVVVANMWIQSSSQNLVINNQSNFVGTSIQLGPVSGAPAVDGNLISLTISGARNVLVDGAKNVFATQLFIYHGAGMWGGTNPVQDNIHAVIDQSNVHYGTGFQFYYSNGTTGTYYPGVNWQLTFVAGGFTIAQAPNTTGGPPPPSGTFTKLIIRGGLVTGAA